MSGPYTLLPVPMFTDNYLWLHVSPDGNAIAVDPGDYALLASILQARQWRLATVFVTHHHPDHCAGLPELRRAYPDVPVYGPARIEGVTRPVSGGEILKTDSFTDWDVLAVPGHTRDHVAYYQAGESLLFCGDTLFSGGCGRIFDGDAASFFHSLQLIAALPDSTRICCTHEYTLANLQFARYVDPDNRALAEYQASAIEIRACNEPTLPVPLGTEKAINPFLRTASPSLRATLRRLLPLPENAADTDWFAALRAYKDTWKPVSP